MFKSFCSDYLLPRADFAIGSDDRMFSRPQIFKEAGWEKFSPTQLPVYFEDGFGIFENRLQKFRKLERVMTYEEERELQFMLESLIHAKNALYEYAK